MLHLVEMSFDDGDDQFEELGIFAKDGSIDKEIHIQIKLSSIRNDFHVRICKQLNGSGEDDESEDLLRPVYELNILRVYYFFSENLDIRKFLNETDVQIRLTYTSDWNNYIAHGSTKT
jgi:hypothetical protein